ncbi:NAD/FAD-binding protein [Polynucleobacter sp. QLW-P1DATA-2]|uniref:NAD(P)/FAD-dependent oxidoreductase n=1 Tax=unclassified Polynucleobacter TaxID=2640945 RepID=UPI0008F92E5D|nr:MULTISPECIES: FAD-dependent oxidoreductase [unclassified Polynucleobacter]OIM97683.1 NAD/FAD-binding protein [Polynucleobacter sp. MWH-Tro8-2-5-gr]OIN03435.1 NAD/FAD-binding protein [Polynucleobacter sp. QLW-P1DATA-2]
MIKKRIAIIGAGISGLGCAYALRQHPEMEITLYEGGDHIGGHSNTVDFTCNIAGQEITHGIDTGFLVFNRKTYPRLVRLFEEIKAPVAPSEMSFSVSIDASEKSPHHPKIEWAGNDLNSFFGQRSNLLSPSFWRMAYDILRFNRMATKLAQQQIDAGHHYAEPDETISNFLDRNRFSQSFRENYFLPMIGAIWSCSVEQMLAFPIQTMVRFCHNHGLLQIQNRPQWLTIKGGSREYVKRIVSALEKHQIAIKREAVLRVNASQGDAAQVEVISSSGSAMFDEVVMACHSDQTLDLVHGIDQQARNILAAVPYQKNRAILHTDTRFLPEAKRCWAAWNYTAKSGTTPSSKQHVSVNYLINRLQPLPEQLKNTQIIVSLNPASEPDPKLVHQEIHYSHPVFDMNAIQAQKELPLIQGTFSIWYCGAWTGFGFHEDGLRSGELVAEALIENIRSPLQSTPKQDAR